MAIPTAFSLHEVGAMDGMVLRALLLECTDHDYEDLTRTIAATITRDFNAHLCEAYARKHWHRPPS